MEQIKISDIQPTHIIINSNQYGKPFIKFSKSIDINKKIFISNSHRDNWYIAAAGFNNLGVDVERIRYFKSTFLKKLFSDYEIQNALRIFNHLESKSDINIAFTTMFSIKEAVSKAIGLGLRTNFKKIKIIFDNRKINIEFNDINYNVVLHLEEHYVFTLVEKVINTN